MRKRGEMVERSFAHVFERGGMRRTWLRGRENVRKRYLVHVAGYNLGVLMRALFGSAPRGRLQPPGTHSCSSWSPRRSSWSLSPPVMPRLRRSSSLLRQTLPDQIATFSSGCYEAGLPRHSRSGWRRACSVDLVRLVPVFTQALC